MEDCDLSKQLDLPESKSSPPHPAKRVIRVVFLTNGHLVRRKGRRRPRNRKGSTVAFKRDSVLLHKFGIHWNRTSIDAAPPCVCTKLHNNLNCTFDTIPLPFFFFHIRWCRTFKRLPTLQPDWSWRADNHLSPEQQRQAADLVPQ